MKGVILAGGNGTRLHPLTKLMNKHLLPVGKYPMFHYAIEKLREAGIKQIMLVTGKKSASLYMDWLGGGTELGLDITYRIQEEAGGIAEALALADGFVQPGEKFVVILGDNLFEAPLAPYIEQFKRERYGAKVLLKQVEDPRRFGVPIFLDEKIIWIEEKPSVPKSNYCVTGIYMFGYEVFGVVSKMSKSSRGELEITDVNNYYASREDLSYSILDGWWIDAGTFESLQQASNRLYNSSPWDESDKESGGS